MKFSILLVSFLFSLAYANRCSQIHPKYWCNLPLIARLCGVGNCDSILQTDSYTKQESTTSPVTVEVYYESYCPDSINFLTKMLYPTWEALKSTGIMEIDLIPYGKAKTTEDKSGSYKFECQHGKMECYGNKIENCLIDYTKSDTNKYLPVIQCMESADDPDSSAPQCTAKHGLPWKDIEKCVDGVKGEQLMAEAGLRTHSLNPPLTWVPWIVINKVHDKNIQKNAVKNLKKLVCDTYKGSRPQQCDVTDTRKITFASAVDNDW